MSAAGKIARRKSSRALDASGPSVCATFSGAPSVGAAFSGAGATGFISPFQFKDPRRSLDCPPAFQEERLRPGGGGDQSQVGGHVVQRRRFRSSLVRAARAVFDLLSSGHRCASCVSRCRESLIGFVHEGLRSSGCRPKKQKLSPVNETVFRRAGAVRED